MTISKREGEVISTASPLWKVISLNIPLTIINPESVVWGHFQSSLSSN